MLCSLNVECVNLVVVQLRGTATLFTEVWGSRREHFPGTGMCVCTWLLLETDILVQWSW